MYTHYIHTDFYSKFLFVSSFRLTFFTYMCEKKLRIPALYILFYFLMYFPEKSLLAHVNSNNDRLQQTFIPGKIVPEIHLKRFPVQEYALFLPSRYRAGTPLPLIIFFDPHGEGGIPVTKYASLAEHYGYILAASNSSRNGLDLRSANAIASNLVEDLSERFSIRDGKVAICGLSGGAKVAMGFAESRREFPTVIYCGAVTQIQPNHRLNFLGFAGTHDMNYADLVAFDMALNGSGFSHFLIQWNGKHEFPSPPVFEDAFRFLETGGIPNYGQKRVTITQAELDREQAIRQKYLEAFQTKNLDWWRSEVNALNKKKDILNERLLGFISLACYSYISGALNMKNIEAAQYILNIYRMADPANTAIRDFEVQLKKKPSR